MGRASKQYLCIQYTALQKKVNSDVMIENGGDNNEHNKED